MSRYLALVGTPLFVLTVCLLTGFTCVEALVVFLGGIISLGFMGWLVVERSRASFFRSLAFWWVSKVLGRPDLIYPR